MKPRFAFVVDFIGGEERLDVISSLDRNQVSPRHSPMHYRPATTADTPLLAKMNHRLIRDEGHRNSMSVAELEVRVEGWITDDYEAVLFEDSTGVAGYALFKRHEDHIYLRQFFIEPIRRRQGVGRAAVKWLLANVWKEATRIRLLAISRFCGLLRYNGARSLKFSEEARSATSPACLDNAGFASTCERCRRTHRTPLTARARCPARHLPRGRVR